MQESVIGQSDQQLKLDLYWAVQQDNYPEQTIKISIRKRIKEIQWSSQHQPNPISPDLLLFNKRNIKLTKVGLKLF